MGTQKPHYGKGLSSQECAHGFITVISFLPEKTRCTYKLSGILE